MNSPLSYRTQMAVNLCSLLTLTIGLACAAQAQVVNPFTSAPPPMKMVSHDERAQLSSARDVKSRTRASLDLAEMRLRRAEELTTALSYDAASSELGCYQGIVEDAMNYLDSLKVDKGKMRDLFKRVELALRAHGTRIEAIRRVTPTEYSINIKPIADYTRNARTEALNAFYGDTVVREEVKRDEKAPAVESVKAFTGGSPQ
ncbi:MAG TPA: hypothetical protein VGC89_18405 [Pyrinomonadaceae bacterium]